MKNKFYKILTIFLGLSCLLLVLRAINLMQNRNELIKNSYSNDYVINKKDNLTMMLETDYDSNQYELATSSEWPTDGYIFNEELSACKNGSKVSWDSETNRVMVYAGSIDSCYIYFDKEPDIIYLADYIKNEVYTGVDGENDIYYHDGVGSYTNSSEESGDSSYRFSGANPNNYVCFGSDEATCPNDNLYRIIGVVDNKVKLIKYEYATTTQLGTNGDYYNTWAGASLDESYYKGTISTTTIGIYYWNRNGSNNWSESQLNTVNLNTNYIGYLNSQNPKWTDMIEMHAWQVGGNTYANIVLNTSRKSAYIYEMVSPTINIIYNAQIGLMYASDYYYAAIPTYWSYAGFSSSASSDYRAASENNWMHMGLYDWMITRRSDGTDDAFGINVSGYVNYGGGVASLNFGIRPTFFLKSNVAITSGDDSSSNPYRLELS